jgi:methyl-accepting chemotaxis protein
MNQSLSKKLIITLLLAGLTPMFVTSILSARFAAKELEKIEYNKLESIREIKAAAIERYFDTINRQVINLAEMRETVNAMGDFSRTFENMGKVDGYDSPEELRNIKTELNNYYVNEYFQEYKKRNNGEIIDVAPLIDNLHPNALVAQYQYIHKNSHPLGEKHLLDAADGPASYHRMHERYHDSFRDFLEKFGYYDIFLIEPENGNIVYSVFKELDYGTSLLNGPYANTNFAEAFKAAKKLPQGEYVLKDFAQYRPSYDAPASFIATPIYKASELVGVLIFQMPLEVINSIMTQRDGMGETGESYLVGEDLLMRSDSFLDPVNHTVVASFKNPELGMVKTDATRRAFANEKNTDVIIDYNGNPVLSAFTLVNIGSGIKWAILAEIDEAEAFKGVSTLAFSLLIIAVIGVVLIILFALYISKLLSTPILGLARGIQAVKDSGNFNLKIDNHYQDEIGQTSDAFTQFIQSLSEVITDTNKALKEVGEGKYTTRVNSNHSGQLGELTQGVNSAINDIKIANDEQRRQAKIADENAQSAKEAAEKAEEQANEVLLIKKALDSSGTSTMIADAENKIVYKNISFNELILSVSAGIKTKIPHLIVDQLIGKDIGIFYIDSSNPQKFLSGLSTTHNADIQFGNHIINVNTTPIIENGTRVGTVIEWLDRTSEVAVEKDIDTIISLAASGNFDQKIDLSDKNGFFLTASKGLNGLLDTTNVVINDVKRVFSAMANGDLSERIEGEYEGSFGQLKEDVNRTVSKLKEIIDEISVSANTIANGVNDISAGNNDLSERTENQASTLEQSSASMEEMTQIVKSNEDSAKQANQLALRTTKNAHEGNAKVQEAIQAMEQITNSSNKIANIISVIDEIAFQTNLLALNAAVEAARAGEQGRGFAVVAGEVRGLAQRSATAAKEISGLIRDSVDKVNDGSILVEASGKTLATIVDEVQEVSNMIESIANGAKEQSIGIQQVSTAILQMDQITQQNAALVEEAAASSANMSDQAREMSKQVSFFR